MITMIIIIIIIIIIITIFTITILIKMFYVKNITNKHLVQINLTLSEEKV